MGGIGSYNAETDRLSDGNIFLLIDDDLSVSPKPNIILCGEYIKSNRVDLLGAYNSTLFERSYAVFEAVKGILKKYPSINKISTHEYSGLGAVTATAVRTGLIPDVTLRVHCHGGHVQLERATGVWEGADIEVLDAERITIENADEVYFPARYLHDLYAASGIKMEKDRVKYLGFPYGVSRAPGNSDGYSDIENIVFIGRMNKLKGFDVFASTVMRILEDGHAHSLKSVVVIGKDDGTLGDLRDKLKRALKDKGIEYSQSLRTRGETLSAIEALSTKSVFILPYYSDNFSVAMLEIIEAGAPLLVLDTGGNKDLLDSSFWKSRCVLEGQDELFLRAVEVIGLSPNDRGEQCVSLQREFFDAQEYINRDNMKLYSSHVSNKTGRQPGSTSKKTSQAIAKIKLINRDTDSSENFETIRVGTGKYTGKGIEDARHYLIFPEAMELDEGCMDAVRDLAGAHLSTMYLLAYKALNGDVRMPRASSVGNMIYRPNLHNSYIAFVSGRKLKAFLDRYREAPAGVSEALRTADDVMYSLIMEALQEPATVSLVPIVAAREIEYARSWSFDEKKVFDIAHNMTSQTWNMFRYMAVVRHSNDLNSFERHSAVISSDADEFISADSRSSKLMRALIRHQVRAIVFAKKIKHRLYP